MDYGKLHKFVRENGEVTVISSGKERKLKSGDSDTIDLVEKAEKFVFSSRLYTKTEFEKLIDSLK